MIKMWLIEVLNYWKIQNEWIDKFSVSIFALFKKTLTLRILSYMIEFQIIYYFILSKIVRIFGKKLFLIDVNFSFIILTNKIIEKIFLYK